MHSIFRTANAIGLAAASASPAPAYVANQNITVCDHWIADNAVTLGSNSLRRAGQSSARRVVEVERASFDDMRRKFAKLRALPNGWDGSSSLAPKVDVVAHAATVLEFAMNNLKFINSPVIVPVADGGVQAEWYSAEHRFEIYFDPDGEVSAWSENRSSGVEMEADGRDAIQMLVQWTSRMNAELVFA